MVVGLVQSISCRMGRISKRSRIDAVQSERSCGRDETIMTKENAHLTWDINLLACSECNRERMITNRIRKVKVVNGPTRFRFVPGGRERKDYLVSPDRIGSSEWGKLIPFSFLFFIGRSSFCHPVPSYPEGIIIIPITTTASSIGFLSHHQIPYIRHFIHRLLILFDWCGIQFTRRYAIGDTYT